MTDPPESVSTSSAERENAALRALIDEYRDALERAQRRPPPLVDAADIATPSERAKADIIGRITKTYGGGLGIVAALALSIYTNYRPVAKPEQVEQVKTQAERVRKEDTMRDSTRDAYNTQLRAAYECRLNQLAVIVNRMGKYELDWRNDNAVMFDASQVGRDSRGLLVEKGPFTVVARTKCPDLPMKPSD